MTKRVLFSGRVLTVVVAIVLCMSMAAPVCAAVLGDCNGDGAVSTDDVVQLLLHLSLPDMFSISGHADFTGDKKVDTEDAVQLLLHISMPDMFPLNPGSGGNSEPVIPDDEDISVPITPDMSQPNNVIDFDDLLEAGKH